MVSHYVHVRDYNLRGKKTRNDVGGPQQRASMSHIHHAGPRVGRAGPETTGRVWGLPVWTMRGHHIQRAVCCG